MTHSDYVTILDFRSSAWKMDRQKFLESCDSQIRSSDKLKTTPLGQVVKFKNA